MKKLILVLLILAGIFISLYLIKNYKATSEDISSNTDTVLDDSSLSESTQSLLPDEVLIPYTDLPNYDYLTEKIALTNEGQRIYGECLIPENGDQKVPLIICCHGLGANLYSVYDYGEIFAQKGMASFMFDFRGGGGSQSEGLMTEMSVLTEVSDLEVVLENARNWDFVDPNNIVLFGQSQGGLVAALTAAQYPDEIAGLILEYPAFIIDDTIKKIDVNTEELQDSFNFGGLTLGKRYILDMMDFDSYGEVQKFKKHVLILQGDEDTIVPVESSGKVSKNYRSAEYFIINGAGHGFYNEQFNESLIYIFNYLERIGIIEIKKG